MKSQLSKLTLLSFLALTSPLFTFAGSQVDRGQAATPDQQQAQDVGVPTDQQVRAAAPYVLTWVLKPR